MKIALLALALAPMLMLGACKEDPYALKPDELLITEAGARDYAERSNAKFLGCSGQDSPPVDGYVTCSVKPLTPANADPVDLVCSYKSRGCKRK